MKINELVGRLMELTVHDPEIPHKTICFTFDGLGLMYDIDKVDTFNGIIYLSSAETMCVEDLESMAKKCLDAYPGMEQKKAKAIQHMLEEGGYYGKHI